MITCNILLHRLFRLQYVRFYLFSLTEQKYDRTGETSYGQVHVDGEMMRMLGGRIEDEAGYIRQAYLPIASVVGLGCAVV